MKESKFKIGDYAKSGKGVVRIIGIRGEEGHYGEWVDVVDAKGQKWLSFSKQMTKLGTSQRSSKHFNKINIMTPINFAYWLQGFFELSSSQSLSLFQQNQVLDHLELTEVWVAGEVHANISKKFTELFSSIRTVNRLSEGGVWSPKMVSLIRTDLDGCFEHVIDPMMEKDNLNAHLFNEAHGGDYKLRC